MNKHFIQEKERNFFLRNHGTSPTFGIQLRDIKNKSRNFLN